MTYGPKYFLCGSSLTDDKQLLRAILEGLNTQARQWSETIVILDNGSLRGLEHEIEEFRHLEYRRVLILGEPNIVIAFMDRLSHNRDIEKTLELAETAGIPTYVISRYGA
jgi:glycogen synthase